MIRKREDLGLAVAAWLGLPINIHNPVNKIFLDTNRRLTIACTPVHVPLYLWFPILFRRLTLSADNLGAFWRALALSGAGSFRKSGRQDWQTRNLQRREEMKMSWSRVFLYSALL